MSKAAEARTDFAHRLIQMAEEEAVLTEAALADAAVVAGTGTAERKERQGVISALPSAEGLHWGDGKS